MGVPNSSAIQVLWRGSLFNQQIRQIGYLRVTQTSTLEYVPEMAAIGDALKATGVGTFGGHMLACMAAEMEWTEIRVQLVAAARDVYVSTPIALAGTHADPCTAPNVSAVINKRCQLLGHRQNSPTHVAGVPDTAYDSGFLTDAYRTLLATWGNDWVNSIIPTAGGGTYKWCQKPIGLALPPATFDLFDFNVNPYLRIMRRRTVGVGK